MMKKGIIYLHTGNINDALKSDAKLTTISSVSTFRKPNGVARPLKEDNRKEYASEGRPIRERSQWIKESERIITMIRKDKETEYFLNVLWGKSTVPFRCN
jgi:hypothetical protein